MYTFKKEERLCNKKLLEKLFHSGSSFILYPFRVITLVSELPEHLLAQVVITVPKHKFKKSPDRNLLKRRIREAYRLQKAEYFYPVLKERNLKLLLAVSYIGKEIESSELIHKKINAVFLKLAKHYADHVVG